MARRALLRPRRTGSTQPVLRLADVDGSGTTDLIYLDGDGARIWLNQSGNRSPTPRPGDRRSPAVDIARRRSRSPTCSARHRLPGLVVAAAGATRSRPLRYIDLMGGGKPHLLAAGAATTSAPRRRSTTPRPPGSTWRTGRAARRGSPGCRSPCTWWNGSRRFDRVSRNRFVTRYAYHHGYFDGVEREFRGFGMVEQYDTEAYDVRCPATRRPSYVPPVLTRTWFHTGVHPGRDRVSQLYAHEYYREPGAWLLDDTQLPPGLTDDEEREACRALRGSMLRQEVYALDARGGGRPVCGYRGQSGTAADPAAGGPPARGVLHPSRGDDQLALRAQPGRPARHARDHVGDQRLRPDHRRGQRRLRPPRADGDLAPERQREQGQPRATYTETTYTNAVADPRRTPDDHRCPHRAGCASTSSPASTSRG